MTFDKRTAIWSKKFSLNSWVGFIIELKYTVKPENICEYVVLMTRWF